jgi:nitrogen fixation protein NifU and related proteins
MDDLYRDFILEHYREPHNFGTLEHPDAVHEGYNPLCGDRITLMLAIDDAGQTEVISDVAFTGRGCAISQASASLLTDRVRGKALSEVARLGRADVLEELGIEISPARLKCALLSLDTLQKALDGRVAWVADADVPAPDELAPGTGDGTAS